jgi:hypothetical protein
VRQDATHTGDTPDADLKRSVVQGVKEVCRERMARSAWKEAQGGRRGHAGAAREGAARGAAFQFLYM